MPFVWSASHLRFGLLNRVVLPAVESESLWQTLVILIPVTAYSNDIVLREDECKARWDGRFCVRKRVYVVIVSGYALSL